MTKSLLICVIMLFGWQAQSSSREVILLDKGWLFLQKEVRHGESPGLNDSEWEKVRVPHDWAITGDFDMNIDMQSVQVTEDGEKTAKLRSGRTGALPCFGVGWYRKVLPITKSDEGRRIFIEFDGAMSQAKIYLNGTFVGEWPYGYSSFQFELTKYLNYGQDNILAVRLENKPESSRWYPGAGIYRNVRLVKTSPVRIAHWGTYIVTPVITEKSAEVNIKTEIDGNTAGNSEVRLVTEIYNASGEIAATVSSTQKLSDKPAFEQVVKVKNPQLWSVESPVRYTAVSRLYVGKEQVDEYKTVFGFRTLRFDNNKGFFLN
ncbi:MAG TPA: beta galactosidase jelly roll domain-containing protein, partial [Prolixibacteraceae bacterium]|nr:beta galactosidase jelly roll domain-containing protein [Prolixibacteraceae bacterium]